MINPKTILYIPMQENDASASTVRDYLVTLLYDLYRDGEGFSSKRPFGNSGWQFELHLALANAGVIEASFYEDGEPEDWDETSADKHILLAIESLR